MPRKEQIDARFIEIYRVIGANIFRRRGKMTQEELARLARVGLSTIISSEKGLPISLESLLKIAAALGCKPEDLFITDEDRKEVSYAHVKLMEKIMETFMGKKLI